MPSPTTRDQFIELVRQSGLVEEDALRERIAAGAALPDDPRELAALFVREKLLTTFQAQRILWGQFRGFYVGNYKVLDQIGSGGMGSVYLCEHRSLGRRVAIKVLPPDKANDPLTVERFYREGRAVAALNHPNIVRAYDIDHAGNLHFLVMEYVDGITLDNVLKKEGPLPIARVADYIRQAANGLQHVHEAGLVHRDIKPANLLRDRQHVVKLLDLGLARFFAHAEQDNLTRNFEDSSILGTADYIAPEQGMNSHDVDIRADIYSLGATLYHLLAGQPPFEGGSVTQKLIMHQMREPTPLRELRPEVPPGLAAVVERMLCKNPARRYQTPAEVAASLAPFATDLPSAGKPSDPRSGVRRTGTGTAANGFHGEPELVTEAPAEGSGIFAWANLAGEEAVYKPDEDPTLPPLVSPSGRKLHGDRSVTAKRAIVAAAIGGPLLVGSVMALWWMLRSDRPAAAVTPTGVPAVIDSKTTTPANPHATGPRVVTLHFPPNGPGKEFASLQEALLQAKPHSRIVLSGDLAECVTLEGTMGKDVTIEAATGGTVHWRPPDNLSVMAPRTGNGAGAGAPALLHATNVAGLHIKGMQLDGQNRIADLIVLTGRCPGVTLDGLTLANFQASAIALHRCAGDYAKPVTLRQLRVLQPPASAAGITFAPVAPGTRSGSQYVHIHDCRFEGALSAAIALNGPVANVEVARNRFFQARAGLLYHKADPLNELHLLLDGNTFCEVGTAIDFEVLPPTDGGSWILAQNNLFVRTGRISGVKGFTGEPPKVAGQWIWTKEANGFTNAPAGTCYFRKTFNVPPSQAAAGTDAAQALLNVVASSDFTAWLNGELVGQGAMASGSVSVFDVTKPLRTGDNVLAIRATGSGGPAGLLAQLSFQRSDGKPATIVCSDGAWKCARQLIEGWERPGFADDAWEPAKVLGSYAQGPWHLLWDAEIVRAFPAPGAHLLQTSAEAAALAKTMYEGTPEVRAAQAQWETGLHERLLAERSAWTAVRPTSVVSERGATMTILDDLSVLASGTNPPQDTYTITLTTDKQHITAICLETLTHPSLGNQSLSRGTGNFVLTRVEAEAVIAASPKALKLASAVTDYSQLGFDIANVINPASTTGWAVDGNVKRMNHAAVFQLAQPLPGGPGTIVTIRLKHESPHANHVIGRFRLALSSADKPPLPESNRLPGDVVALLSADPAQRTVAERTRLTNYFRETTPLLAETRKQLADKQKEQCQLWSPFRGPAGNFRDVASRDTYPYLRPQVFQIALPADPSNDALFLRYDKSSPLRQSGTNGSPVGVPAG